MTNQNIAIRPMNKGMVTNIPSQSIDPGAVLSAGNFNVTTNGLKARGGYKSLTTPVETVSALYNDTFDYVTGDVQNTFVFRQKDGQAKLLTVTNEALYKIDQDEETYTRVSFPGTFTPYSVSLYGTDQIMILQEYNDEQIGFYVDLDTEHEITETLNADDYIKFGDEIGQVESTDFETIDEVTYYRIYINVDNTDNWTSFDTSSDTMTAELNFQTNTNYKVDHAFVSGVDTNKIVFTSNRGRALAEYDSTGIISVVNIDSTSSVSDAYDITITDAKACRWFKNRLWIGSTIEDGGVYRQRIRWSEATTYLNYDTADTFDPANYLDLNDSTGEVLAIYPMGEILMVYCSDAIYYGRQTNLTGLPYTFTKINTPNLGLVGQSAITPWIDGHYFVAQDEIYFMSSASSLQPIGTTVGDLTIDACYNKAGIDVRPDPEHSRILFLFPEQFIGDSEVEDLNCASKVWSYNYKTGGWSYLEAAYTLSGSEKDYKYYYSSISSSILYNGDSSWQDQIDLDAVGDGVASTINNWDTWATTYSTWYDLMSGDFSDQTLLYGLVFRDTSTGVLKTDFYIEMETGYQDIIGYNKTYYDVTKSLVSADYDYDIPDDNKQVNRFSLKLEDHLDTTTEFDVYVSNNRGRIYKPIGGLYIKADDDEGRINFRSKGSTFRFKIESNDLNVNTINELVMRLSKRGEEN